MDLFIIRHAQAEPPTGGSDAERPLSPVGRDAFRRLLKHLDALPPRIGRLAASPYVRAQETAKLLCEVKGWAPAESWPELLPDSEPRLALRRIAAERSASVAVVGHQPLVGQLVADLTTDEPVFHPGTILLLDYDGRGRAQVRWTASP